MNKKVVKYAVSAALAVVLLYLSFRGVKWDEFMSALKCCHWWWVVAAMLAGVASFWFRALRWKGLLAPIDSSTSSKTVFNAVNIGLFTNLILPRVGEFIRCGVITRNSAPAEDGKQHLASYDKVLGTVVMERSWDILTLILILCTVMVTMWSRFGGFVEEKILQPFAGRFNADVWWLFAGLVLLCAAGVLAVWKLRNRSKVISALFGFVKGLWQGVVSCFRMKRWWVFLIYTALIWLMYWLMSWTILRSLSGVDVSALSLDFSAAVSRLSELGPSDALFLMLVGSLSSLVPVPGGFGAFHYIVATALASVYGIPFPVGIIFATLSHESQTIAVLLCGAGSYVSESMS